MITAQEVWIYQAFACLIGWCVLGIFAVLYYITKD